MRSIIIAMALILGSFAAFAQPAQFWHPPMLAQEPLPGPEWPPWELQHQGYLCDLGGELLQLTIDYRNKTVRELVADKDRPQITGKPRGTYKADMPNRNAITYERDGKRIFLDLKGRAFQGHKITSDKDKPGACRMFD